MTESPSPLTRLRHYCEYLIVAGASKLLSRASMATVRSRGMALGRIAYRLSGARRRIARENIAQAFPELPPAEWDRLARAAFEHFGRVLLEVLRFSTLSTHQMKDLCDVEGEEHVLRGYAAGKGIIFMSAHFGYWEMAGITNPLYWRPISVIARPLDNPRLHGMLEHIRTRTGNEVIYRQGSIRKVLRALASNRGVAMLIDQHLQGQEAVHVNFFGRPAAATPIVASLVLRTGATVVPAFSMPLPEGRYRFVYCEPMDPPRDDSQAAIHDFTQRCADVTERFVRQDPDLWLWMHRRWRESPAGVPERAGADDAPATPSGERV